MDLITKLMNVTILVTTGTVILFVAGEISQRSIILTMRSLLKIDILTLIVMFLGLALIIMEMISY